MEKQKDNPKFSFLFGGEFYSYYKCKLALEQQQLICKQQAPELEPAAALPPLPQPPLAPAAPIPPTQGTPSMDELIQQSQWNLQQQEQHLLALRQVWAQSFPPPVQSLPPFLSLPEAGSRSSPSVPQFLHWYLGANDRWHC